MTTTTLLKTITTRLTMFAVAIAIVFGVALTAAGTAEATTTRCSDGRCVVYLSKQETRDLGQGRAPRLPGGVALADQPQLQRVDQGPSVHCPPVRQPRVVLGLLDVDPPVGEPGLHRLRLLATAPGGRRFTRPPPGYERFDWPTMFRR